MTDLLRLPWPLRVVVYLLIRVCARVYIGPGRACAYAWCPFNRRCGSACCFHHAAEEQRASRPTVFRVALGCGHLVEAPDVASRLVECPQGCGASSYVVDPETPAPA